MHKICLIEFKSYAVLVTETSSGQLCCFKYDDIRCDIEYFQDQDMASDWIFEPFQDFNYYVEVIE